MRDEIAAETAAETVGRIRGLVVEQLGVEAGDVIAGASIFDDLGADSLDVVELVMALEEAFDIEIPDEAMEVMKTIGDVEAYVASQIAPH